MEEKSIVLKFLEYLVSLFRPKRRFVFRQVLINGTYVRGNIKMTKLEFNQAVTFTAEPVDRRGNEAAIQPGTAVFSVAATDATGADVSDQLTLAVDPANELSVTVTSAKTALTATLTLRADGDPDENVEADIIGTESIIVAPANAIAFALTAGTPTDV